VTLLTPNSIVQMMSLVMDVPDQFDAKFLHYLIQPQCCVFHILEWHFVTMRELLALVALISQMFCDSYFDRFAKKEEICISSMCVAEMLLATDHMRNAPRLVSAVELLCLMCEYIGQEDGSLGDRFVGAFLQLMMSLEMACLGIEAKLSTCCRMFRAKGYLFYR
jgi:hypothetical protein